MSFGFRGVRSDIESLRDIHKFYLSVCCYIKLRLLWFGYLQSCCLYQHHTKRTTKNFHHINWYNWFISGTLMTFSSSCLCLFYVYYAKLSFSDWSYCPHYCRFPVFFIFTPISWYLSGTDAFYLFSTYFYSVNTLLLHLNCLLLVV